MFRTRLLPISIATAAVLMTASAAPAQQVPVLVACPAPLAAPTVVDEAIPFGGVGLKIRDEAAPPGGTAQMKVYITEPRPIATGGARVSFDDFESIEGIALSTSSDDGYGLAVISGKTLALSFVSPSGTFGTEPDYPVLTIVGRVPETARIGSSLKFSIDPAGMQFSDPSGAVYPTEFQNGILSVQPVISIDDVQPGSAQLDAGSKVTILGSNFQPGTRIRFGETDLSSVDFVDAGRIDVTLAIPANMHGMRIRAENKDRKDRSKTTYFSYHRTRRAAVMSADPLLASIVPIFPRTSTAGVLLDVAVDTIGVAIQNINSAAADVTVDLLDARGEPIQTVALSVPSSEFMVLSLAEIFGAAVVAPVTVRVSSPLVPVQVLGVASDGVNVRPQVAR